MRVPAKYAPEQILWWSAAVKHSFSQ